VQCNSLILSFIKHLSALIYLTYFHISSIFCHFHHNEPCVRSHTRAGSDSYVLRVDVPATGCVRPRRNNGA